MAFIDRLMVLMLIWKVKLKKWVLLMLRNVLSSSFMRIMIPQI